MATSDTTSLMQKIVSLCKRRGFVFGGSEIYGGLANTYDMGPLGVLVLRNIINHWWKTFVTKRPDIYGLDTSILMSPKVWEASGHTENFTDELIDCLECKFRTRADHVIEDYLEEIGKTEVMDGLPSAELDKLIREYKIKCPKCGKSNWTKSRKFNQLFETSMGILEGDKNTVYLRGEIAQGMFVNFKNVLDTMRPKLPFGIAQSGKAFRNEITLGNFIFRNVEFNLAEFEYFFNPKETKWEELYEYWKKEMESWFLSLGVAKENVSWREHTDAERSHYSSMTMDLDYKFGFGTKEMFGLAYRTDFDLKNHTEKSGTDLRYINPSTGEKIMPHVIEPTFGINRVMLALLTEAYVEEEGRLVLKLHKDISPYKVAVFPLVKNKPELVEKAKEIFNTFVDAGVSTAWDDRGNIGKRYYAQDEIGTTYCVTVDYQTLEDGTVTLRDRDTMEQKRLPIEDIFTHV